jgi:predicted SnoaL-like aldol condensation-catalyzing enzyme
LYAIRFLLTLFLILAASAGPLLAKTINPPTKPQTAPMNVQEKKNLDLALNWWREVLQGRHVELASQYQAEDYIQHNPNVPQGRDSFKEFMSHIPGCRPEDAKPLKEKWINPPVLTLVNGPYSFMMWDRVAKDPDDPSREYHWNHFDVPRVKNGMIKEHWDEAVINPPGANSMQ